MSITRQIKKRIAGLHGRKIFYLAPSMPGDAIVREMYASNEVMETVNKPWSENWMGQRHKEFRATLDSFTRGDRMPVSERPFDKSPEAVVARVHPVGDEVWDIRCLAPDARIRCFGAFGGKNLFIALTWEYRENLVTKNDWDDEIEHCKAEWHRLFQTIPRFQGGSLDDYLSNYYAV